MGLWPIFRTHILGVNAGAAHAGEPEVKGLGVAGMDRLGALEDRGRVGGFEFGQGGLPVGVEIIRKRGNAAVLAKFVEGFVNSGHDGKDELRRTKDEGKSGRKRTQGARKICGDLQKIKVHF